MISETMELTVPHTSDTRVEMMFLLWEKTGTAYPVSGDVTMHALVPYFLN